MVVKPLNPVKIREAKPSGRVDICLMDDSFAMVSWIEDQFLSLGLFGNTESWLINSPDDMNAAAKEKLIDGPLMLEGRSLSFLFQSDSPFLKKLLKSPEISHLQVEALKPLVHYGLLLRMYLHEFDISALESLADELDSSYLHLTR